MIELGKIPKDGVRVDENSCDGATEKLKIYWVVTSKKNGQNKRNEREHGINFNKFIKLFWIRECDIESDNK